MKRDDNGDRVYKPLWRSGCGGGEVDSDYEVDTIELPVDGGDW